MKKKFKTKKHFYFNFLSVFIVFFIVFIFFIVLLYFSKFRNNKDVLTLLSYSNNYDVDFDSFKNDMYNVLFGVDINNPMSILENTIDYSFYSSGNLFAFSKNNIFNDEPEVYIYNTHQSEEYVSSDVMPQSTVMTGAYYLKDLLEGIGVKTLVEESNIKDILDSNNWNYTDSYKASRINLERVKNEYPSIKIFIDFHRDAVSRNISTIMIGDKSCAKVLFVIGKEHEKYLDNLSFTTNLNNLISSKYDGLSKGILQKEGWGVNGIYNQDVGSNVILMEVGGNENTFDEVINTLDLIAPIIKESIYG